VKGAGNKFLAPISPVTRTVESVGATLDRVEKPHPLRPACPLEWVRLLRDSRACGVP
jgi:hypothetical protein